MDVFRSASQSPLHNLALEHELLGQADRRPLLLCWVSGPAVVIGRNQNPWQEVNLDYISKHGIQLVRRESGGGAVYHDTGNLNCSFIAPQAGDAVEKNLLLLVRALHSIGVRAKHNAHHDITVGGRKVSGSAFRISKGRALHHATLLVSAHLRHLRGSLRPTPEGGLAVHNSTAIPSRRSSVTNISEHVPSALRSRNLLERLIEAIAAHAGTDNPLSTAAGRPPAPPPAGSCQPIDPAAGYAGVSEQVQVLGEWGWRYGRTPPCDVVIKHDESSSILLNLCEGIICSVKYNSKIASREKIENTLQGMLGSQRYDRETIRSALQATGRGTGGNGGLMPGAAKAEIKCLRAILHTLLTYSAV